MRVSRISMDWPFLITQRKFQLQRKKKKKKKAKERTLSGNNFVTCINTGIIYLIISACSRCEIANSKVINFPVWNVSCSCDSPCPFFLSYAIIILYNIVVIQVMEKLVMFPLVGVIMTVIWQKLHLTLLSSRWLTWHFLSVPAQSGSLALSKLDCPVTLNCTS